MKGVNKAIIVGTLGQDPDVKYSSSGSAICTVSVATSESWKDKNTGEKVEKTEWHRVVMFGKLGEIAAQYLKKGQQAYFEGKIQTNKYQGQDGQDRYSTQIVAHEMQMLGSSQSNNGQTNQQQQSPTQAQNQTDAPPADEGFDKLPF